MKYILSLILLIGTGIKAQSIHFIWEGEDDKPTGTVVFSTKSYLVRDRGVVDQWFGKNDVVTQVEYDSLVYIINDMTRYYWSDDSINSKTYIKERTTIGSSLYYIAFFNDKNKEYCHYWLEGRNMTLFFDEFVRRWKAAEFDCKKNYFCCYCYSSKPGGTDK